jgi:hypothetical protein
VKAREEEPTSERLFPFSVLNTNAEGGIERAKVSKKVVATILRESFRPLAERNHFDLDILLLSAFGSLSIDSSASTLF